MKPIIGIILRNETLPSKNKILYTNEEINKKITKSNGIPLGIDIKNINEVINLIDGFIFQGGNEYQKEEKELIEFLYKNNVPTFGICLGMQEIAEVFKGNLKRINNHKNNNHEINIRQNTLLYDIIKKDRIITNSRHEWAVENTNLLVSASSSDNTIEAIEDKKKDFFIGVEWHPESLENEDSDNLFNYFIKKAGEYNEFKRSNKSHTWTNN